MALWRVLVVHGVPLLVAIGAGLLMLLWIMGASAVKGDTPRLGYSVGLGALFLYPVGYQVLIIAWGICRWRGWSLARLFMQLIWFCLMLFAGAMAYAIVLLQPYLQV
jgi:vacuolar-type H+-ATPase subunit I/STV1